MHQREIDKLLDELLRSPIAYHQMYAKITGSITAGLLLSQICYWDSRMHRIFWKTNDDFAEELGMGLSEFKAAKSKLIQAGFITVTRRGVPATSHYYLHKSVVFAQIRSWLKFDQVEGKNQTGKLAGIKPTITKTTTKEYSENTKTTQKFSSQEILVLELEKARKIAAEYDLKLHKILPSRTRGEKTTYNRLREHLTKLYVASDTNIFFKVLEIAKEVRMVECENPRGLFIARCKKDFQFRGKGVKGKIL